MFTASFIYALTVQRSVRGDQQQFVPQLSVTAAFLLVVASVGMFMAFINHITTSIQVSHIISQVGDETVGAVRAYFPEPGDSSVTKQPIAPERSLQGRSGNAMTVTSQRRHGHIAQIDYDALADCASKHSTTIELLLPVGSFVPEDQPLARVWDSEDIPDDVARTIGRAVTLESDRAAHQDPAFGVRRLVDIADRALSPGINDPTTATQVVDELHRILRILVRRQTPQALVEVDGGRIVHRPQTVPELLSLAVEEVLHYGEDTVQIPTRLRAMLSDLLDQALPPYQELIRRWLDAIPEQVPREARP